MSVLLAGGGLRPGVVGASNSKGEVPAFFAMIKGGLWQSIKLLIFQSARLWMAISSVLAIAHVQLYRES